MVPTPLREIDLQGAPEDFTGDIKKLWKDIYSSLKLDYTWIPDGVAVRPSSMREMAYRAAEQSVRRMIRFYTQKRKEAE